MSIINNISTAAGDTLYIKTAVAAVGLLTLTGFVDSTQNESGLDVFTKTFRYSLDGITYSDWLPLTVANIQAVPVLPKDSILLEYRYLKTTSSDTPLAFNSNTVSGTYDNTSTTCGYYFNNSNFKEFFDCSSFEVLAWYINVTEKLYQSGLVAEFIERVNDKGSSDDYIFFWKAIAKFFAYFVIYARNYQKFYTNKNLLTEYLKERGLDVSQYDGLDQLYYLMNTFPQQIYNRGTNHIVDLVENGAPANGEYVRHISYKAFDEFLFNLYRPQDLGWNLRNSSPLFRGLRGQQNINKAYEKNDLIVNLVLYPLVNRASVSIANDSSIGQNVLSFNAATLETGIGNTTEYKPIKIDSSLDYEISFFIKKSAGTTFNFGVNSYDLNDNLLTNLSNKDNSATNFFLQSAVLSRADTYIFVRGIIYNYKKPNFSQDKLNVNAGNNLIFKPNAKKIIPYITIISGIASIHDLQILPLFTLYSRGLIQVKNFISSWIINNRTGLSQDAKTLLTDNTQVIYNPNTIDNETYTSKYLIPYNSHIKINNIGDYFYKDVDAVVIPAIQLGYRPINPTCELNVSGNNTGRKSYANIEQYSLATSIATGVVLANSSSNPASNLPYFPITVDTINCAVARPTAFVAITPYCEQLLNQTANITGFSNPSNIAYANNLFFVSDTGSNSVKVVDPTQNIIVATIAVGVNPRQIIYISSRNVICVKLQNGNVIIINPLTFAISSNITPPSLNNFAPSLTYVTKSDCLATVDNQNGIAYTFDFNGNTLRTITGVTRGLYILEESVNGKLYINQSSSSSNTGTNMFVARLGDTTPYITITLSTLAGDFSSSMAFYVTGNKIYASGYVSKSLFVINTTTDTLANTVIFPLGIPGAVTYQPGVAKVYVCNYDATNKTIYVINPVDDSIISDVQSQIAVIAIQYGAINDSLYSVNVNNSVSQIPNAPQYQNDGLQGMRQLQLYYTDNNTAVTPINIKNNITSDPNYSAPSSNIANCPIPASLTPAKIQINDETGPLNYTLTDQTTASGNKTFQTVGSGVSYNANGILKSNDTFKITINSPTSNISKLSVTVNGTQSSLNVSDLATFTFVPAPNSLVIITAKAQVVPVTQVPANMPYSQANVLSTNTLWVSNYGNGTIQVIDENSNAVIQTIQVIPANSSKPLREIVYVASTDKIWVKDQGSTIYVIDTRTYQIIYTLVPSTNSYSISLLVLPDLGKVYNFSSNGFVDVWNVNTYLKTTTINTPGYRLGQAVYDQTNQIAYATTYSGGVIKLNAVSDSFISYLQLGGTSDYIYGVAVNNATNTVYALNNSTSLIYIVNLTSFTLTNSIAAGGTGPIRIRYSTGRNLYYICYGNSSIVRTLNPATNTFVDNVAIAASSSDLIYVPYNSKVYTMGFYKNLICIIT